MAKSPSSKTVETLTHIEATRKNIPTAEYSSVLDEQSAAPRTLRETLIYSNHIDYM